MGCAAAVRVVAADGATASSLADAAVARVAELERRWSRFVPDSEVNGLNAAGGRPVVVSRDTAALVAAMVDAWRLTHGRYDPTMLDALRSVGYADSWDADRTFVAGASPDALLPGRGCDAIGVDVESGLVELPAGTAVEPGGIGKGLAGDLVTDEAIAAGAAGVMVDLGGDVRVQGDAVDGSTWLVAIEDPHDEGRDLAVVEIDSGAVCTSSRLIRRWSTPTGPAHHLLDPETGRPVAGDLDTVSVVAGEGWWAEALAKAAFVAGLPEALDVISDAGCGGVLVESGGLVVRTGDFFVEVAA